jgi:hypothetical protein
MSFRERKKLCSKLDDITGVDSTVIIERIEPYGHRAVFWNPYLGALEGHLAHSSRALSPSYILTSHTPEVRIRSRRSNAPAVAGQSDPAHLPAVRMVAGAERIRRKFPILANMPTLGAGGVSTMCLSPVTTPLPVRVPRYLELEWLGNGRGRITAASLLSLPLSRGPSSSDHLLCVWWCGIPAPPLPALLRIRVEWGGGTVLSMREGGKILMEKNNTFRNILI